MVAAAKAAVFQALLDDALARLVAELAWHDVPPEAEWGVRWRGASMRHRSQNIWR